jgi:hypothetical protein
LDLSEAFSRHFEPKLSMVLLQGVLRRVGAIVDVHTPSKPHDDSSWIVKKQRIRERVISALKPKQKDPNDLPWIS